MRKLPPLYALQCFEATVKFGTVREASNRLYISPSAVSHQITKLESYLDIQLFYRHNKRLILTDAGFNYLKKIEKALEYIEDATWDSVESSKEERLELSLPPSFSNLTIIPKLNDLMLLMPEVNLKLNDNLLMDECLNTVDAGIEYRFDKPTDRFSECLFSDKVIPLASPQFLRENTLNQVSDLKGKTLIITGRRFNSWKVVLKEQKWLNQCRLITVRYTHQALQAAESGLGVALGNPYNASMYLEGGRLVKPFDVEYDKSQVPSYFFSCREEKRQTKNVALFYQWIKSEVVMD